MQSNHEKRQLGLRPTKKTDQSNEVSFLVVSCSCSCLKHDQELYTTTTTTQMLICLILILTVATFYFLKGDKIRLFFSMNEVVSLMYNIQTYMFITRSISHLHEYTNTCIMKHALSSNYVEDLKKGKTITTF